MKVKELIEFLRSQNPEAIVLLSSDEEGNSYSPVDIEHCGYVTGNFDDEENDIINILSDIYTMNEEEMRGDYIILYPR